MKHRFITSLAMLLATCSAGDMFGETPFNAVMRSQIDAVCRSLGYEPSTICTPDELMEP